MLYFLHGGMLLVQAHFFYHHMIRFAFIAILAGAPPILFAVFAYIKMANNVNVPLYVLITTQLVFLSGGTYLSRLDFYFFVMFLALCIVMIMRNFILLAKCVISVVAIHIAAMIFLLPRLEWLDHYRIFMEFLFFLFGSVLFLLVTYNVEQNAVLAHVNRTKTVFLANASHEMRTPLTITSVNVQTVIEKLDDMGVKDDETVKLLQMAQSEIMRLARMVGGMLSLASISDSAERGPVDFSALLVNSAEMLQLSLKNHGNSFETGIEEGLHIFGNTDLLVQVITNILQNAGVHTKNGKITLSAKKTEGTITVSIADTGRGIAKEILSRVFERGVSDKGTGFGLYFCKMVVESHGGSIWIESEENSGTTVHFTLPDYEGQFGV
jgi:signal transduction histidine kinase